MKYTEEMGEAVDMMININMRCIEMAEYNNIWTMLYRLTLTWDVLKYLFIAIIST